MARWGFGGLVTSAALLVSVSPARAHHSFAAVFDASQPITVQGTVTEVRLENPHSTHFAASAQFNLTSSSRMNDRRAFLLGSVLVSFQKAA